MPTVLYTIPLYYTTPIISYYTIVMSSNMLIWTNLKTNIISSSKGIFQCHSIFQFSWICCCFPNFLYNPLSFGHNLAVKGPVCSPIARVTSSQHLTPDNRPGYLLSTPDTYHTSLIQRISPAHQNYTQCNGLFLKCRGKDNEGCKLCGSLKTLAQTLTTQRMER